MTSNIEFLDLTYSFESGIGAATAGRYLNEYTIEIYGDGFDNGGNEIKPILIGKAKVTLVLLSLAINNGFSYYQIFDTSEELLELGNVIFDLELEQYNEVVDRYNLEPFNSNLLYIDRIEILPEYRHAGWGKKVIKDILCRFSGCYGLMILKAFPLQLKVDRDTTDDWNIQMEFEKLEQDAKVATTKLNSFYKSLGFVKLLNADYFLCNPELKNSKLDKINIDD
jgi:hypothetical protein